MIVGPHPLRGSLLHLDQTVPVGLAQPLMPDRSVEPLYAGILLRLAGLDVSQLDTGLEVYCQPQTVAFNVKSVQRRPCLKATGDW